MVILDVMLMFIAVLVLIESKVTLRTIREGNNFVGTRDVARRSLEVIPYVCVIYIGMELKWLMNYTHDTEYENIPLSDHIIWFMVEGSMMFIIISLCKIVKKVFMKLNYFSHKVNAITVQGNTDFADYADINESSKQVR